MLLHRRACRSVAVRSAPGPSRPTCEQIRAILQCPGQAAPLPGLRCGLQGRCDNHFSRQCRVCLRDEIHDQRGWVAPVIGWALRTPRLAVAVAAADPAQLPTGPTWLAPGPADSAVPVLTTALNRAQRFAAVGTHRCRNLCCTSLVQRDQQISHRAWRRGTPVGEHSGPVQQCLGKLPPFGPSARHGLDDPGNRAVVQPRLPATHQVDDDADRIGNHLGREYPRQRSAFHRGDAGSFGSQVADSGVVAAGGTLLARRCSGRDRFDQLVHRAVEDVQQRHQDL